MLGHWYSLLSFKSFYYKCDSQNWADANNDLTSRVGQKLEYSFHTLYSVLMKWLSKKTFYPQDTFGNIWRHFWLSLLGRWAMGLLKSSKQRSGMLLNTLQYTGQPHERNYTAQNVNYTYVRNSMNPKTIHQNFWKLWSPWLIWTFQNYICNYI